MERREQVNNIDKTYIETRYDYHHHLNTAAYPWCCLLTALKLSTSTILIGNKTLGNNKDEKIAAIEKVVSFIEHQQANTLLLLREVLQIQTGVCVPKDANAALKAIYHVVRRRSLCNVLGFLLWLLDRFPIETIPLPEGMKPENNTTATFVKVLAELTRCAQPSLVRWSVKTVWHLSWNSSVVDFELLVLHYQYLSQQRLIEYSVQGDLLKLMLQLGFIGMPCLRATLYISGDTKMLNLHELFRNEQTSNPNALTQLFQRFNIGVVRKQLKLSLVHVFKRTVVSILSNPQGNEKQEDTAFADLDSLNDLLPVQIHDAVESSLKAMEDLMPGQSALMSVSSTVFSATVHTFSADIDLPAAIDPEEVDDLVDSVYETVFVAEPGTGLRASPTPAEKTPIAEEGSIVQCFLSLTFELLFGDPLPPHTLDYFPNLQLRSVSLSPFSSCELIDLVFDILTVSPTLQVLAMGLSDLHIFLLASNIHIQQFMSVPNYMNKLYEFLQQIPSELKLREQEEHMIYLKIVDIIAAILLFKVELISEEGLRNNIDRSTTKIPMETIFTSYHRVFGGFLQEIIAQFSFDEASLALISGVLERVASVCVKEDACLMSYLAHFIEDFCLYFPTKHQGLLTALTKSLCWNRIMSKRKQFVLQPLMNVTGRESVNAVPQLGLHLRNNAFVDSYLVEVALKTLAPLCSLSSREVPVSCATGALKRLKLYQKFMTEAHSKSKTFTKQFDSQFPYVLSGIYDLEADNLAMLFQEIMKTFQCTEGRQCSFCEVNSRAVFQHLSLVESSVFTKDFSKTLFAHFALPQKQRLEQVAKDKLLKASELVRYRKIETDMFKSILREICPGCCLSTRTDQDFPSHCDHIAGLEKRLVRFLTHLWLESSDHLSTVGTNRTKTSVRVLNNGQRIHPSHMQCSICRFSFGKLSVDEARIELEGLLVCKDCAAIQSTDRVVNHSTTEKSYFDEQTEICTLCQCIVYPDGNAVTGLDMANFYHAQCFKQWVSQVGCCSICSGKLTLSENYAVSTTRNSFVCEKCHERSQRLSCVCCKEDIINREEGRYVTGACLSGTIRLSIDDSGSSLQLCQEGFYTHQACFKCHECQYAQPGEAFLYAVVCDGKLILSCERHWQKMVVLLQNSINRPFAATVPLLSSQLHDTKVKLAVFQPPNWNLRFSKLEGIREKFPKRGLDRKKVTFQNSAKKLNSEAETRRASVMQHPRLLWQKTFVPSLFAAGKTNEASSHMQREAHAGTNASMTAPSRLSTADTICMTWTHLVRCTHPGCYHEEIKALL